MAYNEQTKFIQILCNQLKCRDASDRPLVEDGYMGDNTIAAIKKLPTLRKKDPNVMTTNERVATTHIQNVLGLTADGFFGDNTKLAVENFQGMKGLRPVDGIVGYNTWMAFANNTSGTSTGGSSSSDTNFELIVTSGYEHDSGRFKYNFIEPAIKKLKELKNSYDKRNHIITWIIDEGSYTSTDMSNFSTIASNIGVNVEFISSVHEFMNYINTGSTSGNKTRSEKIKNFTMFCHGYSDYLDFGVAAKIYEYNIYNLNSSSFKDCTSYFYSCNTATGNLGQAWANVTRGSVTACVNKTEYQYLIHERGQSLVERQFDDLKRTNSYGFAKEGSERYPELGVNAYWKTFYPR